MSLVIGNLCFFPPSVQSRDIQVFPFGTGDSGGESCRHVGLEQELEVTLTPAPGATTSLSVIIRLAFPCE